MVTSTSKPYARNRYRRNIDTQRLASVFNVYPWEYFDAEELDWMEEKYKANERQASYSFRKIFPDEDDPFSGERLIIADQFREVLRCFWADQA